MSQNEIVVSARSLHEYCVKVLKNTGVPITDARVVAEILVEANLTGRDSHGVVRLPAYTRAVMNGTINSKPDITVKSRDNSIIILDGDNGLGPVVAKRGMKEAISMAESNGVGIAGVFQANHFGAASCYSMLALDHDMIGVTICNSPPAIAPWGGIKAMLGTNPLAVAIPTGQEPALVLDIAMSAVAKGKIRLHSRRGEEIPVGWALDRWGRSTTNLDEALEGTMYPLGGVKGYGLALVIEILSGVLTGASFGSRVGSIYNNKIVPRNVGLLFMALKIDSFMPAALFKERMTQLIADIKNCPRAEGVDEIFIPGEIEYNIKKQRQKDGIPFAKEQITELELLAGEVGADFSFDRP